MSPILKKSIQEEGFYDVDTVVVCGYYMSFLLHYVIV